MVKNSKRMNISEKRIYVIHAAAFQGIYQWSGWIRNMVNDACFIFDLNCKGWKVLNSWESFCAASCTIDSDDTCIYIKELVFWSNKR